MITLSVFQLLGLLTLALMIQQLLLVGVKRFKGERGAQYPTPAKFEDFDIDYNYVALRCNHYSEKYDEYCTLDSRHNALVENGTILHRGSKHQWLQPALTLKHKVPTSLGVALVGFDMYEKNQKAFETEQLASMSILRSARGYSDKPFQCNALNPDPSYPRYCTKRTDHRDSTDSQMRRHGYAGVFWD